MIPFRDNIPSRTFPIVTVSLIVINVTTFFYEFLLGPSLERFLFSYAIVPAKWFLLAHPDISFLGVLFPYISSQFLHGGLLHLIGNMWYLWIFGDNVEDRLGHVRFLAFYLFCGIIAGLFHTLFNLNSRVPSIGASGAIAGVLGAYLVTFPHARVLALVPILFFWQIVEIPAIIFLGFWFVMQFLNGMASIAVTASTGGVAWMAHVGGFISGVYFIRKMRYNKC